MSSPSPFARLMPRLRAVLVLVLVSSTTSALAFCQPPDDSIDWRMVGEIVQNERTSRVATNRLTPWSTVDSVANLGTVARRETLSASFTENQIVSLSILRWGIGQNHSSTRTHTVSVTVAPRTRVRLMRQRQEEIRDLTWDVVCAWQHRRTGRAAITAYGRYSGTQWQVYDGFDVRTDPL
ncbi:hypothetical protein BH23DEI1_BH23DEI1_15540 [soil metagenome]|nr:hypothetical protein [Trueperaceae bacterium]